MPSATTVPTKTATAAAQQPVCAQQQPQQPALVTETANPIGKLQEFAQKRLWPLPAYAFECSSVDNPLVRQFFCTVRLRDASVKAAGFSKRQAKREAAAALLRRLQQQASTPNSSPVQTPKQSPKASPGTAVAVACSLDEADFQSLRASKRLQSAARAGAEVDGLFREVRNRKAGAALPAIEAPGILVPSGGRSASEQLLELGRTHRFGIQFLNEQQQRNRCVLKLSTMPTIVVVATGASPVDSREQACLTALEYLSVLTRENTGSVTAAAASKK